MLTRLCYASWKCAQFDWSLMSRFANIRVSLTIQFTYHDNNSKRYAISFKPVPHFLLIFRENQNVLIVNMICVLVFNQIFLFKWVRQHFKSRILIHILCEKIVAIEVGACVSFRVVMEKFAYFPNFANGYSIMQPHIQWVCSNTLSL